MPESEDRGIAVMRGVAANDNGGAEARIDAAVVTLARLIGRRIRARKLDRLDAANDNFAGKRKMIFSARCVPIDILGRRRRRLGVEVKSRSEVTAVEMASAEGRPQEVPRARNWTGSTPPTTTRRRRMPARNRRPEAMTLRCALYARYSSDQQRAASIEDQFRVCRERAEREGWKIAGAYKDSAVSGASMILRPGIQALLDDARRGLFEILVAEALDRVSRDQADVATLYKHLKFAGVMIVTLSEGEINELHVGLKGTMNALFLKDLAAKTHRGLRGRVEQGRSGGGLCYGYDVVKSLDGSGDPVRGGRTVNETEAEIVRRVFREFADGASPRAIARRLNGEGIPGPSGKLWMDTTIRGHARRGTGLINNELYIGRLVWNRLRYVKNPETGKRVSRINPPEEWIVAEVPELRIVDDDALEGGQGPPGRDHGAIRHHYRGHAIRTRQPAERRPPAPPPALGPARMRRLRRPLFHARPGPLRLLQPYHDRHLLERQGHPPHSNRRAGAVRTEGPADGPEAAAEAMRAYAEETNRINRERRASGAGERKELAGSRRRSPP